MNYINTKCPRCGIVHNCNFCPNCGLQAPQPIVYGYGNQPLMNSPVPKKKMHGCLVATITFFVVVFAFVIMINILNSIIPIMNKTVDNINNVAVTPTSTSSETELKETLLEFDSESWEQFKSLYISHNNLMKAVSLYSENSITSLEFYNYCKDFKEYFQNMSSNFNWGKTEDEKTYLTTFETFALADQQATEYLIKYIDSSKTSDLSKAQEAIQRAKDAATMIASNRGILLVKAGLTDEEILDKIESDMAELEEEMKE